jgi:hypothetical protein
VQRPTNRPTKEKKRPKTTGAPQKYIPELAGGGGKGESIDISVTISVVQPRGGSVLVSEEEMERAV